VGIHELLGGLKKRIFHSQADPDLTGQRQPGIEQAAIFGEFADGLMKIEICIENFLFVPRSWAILFRWLP